MADGAASRSSQQADHAKDMSGLDIEEPFLKLVSADKEKFRIRKSEALGVPALAPLFSNSQGACKQLDAQKNADVDGAVATVVLDKVSSKALQDALQYCRISRMAGTGREGLETAKAEWLNVVKNYGPLDVIDITNAAFHLGIQELISLTCTLVTEHLTGRSAEEVREAFQLANPNLPPPPETIPKVRLVSPQPKEDTRPLDELVAFINNENEALETVSKKKKKPKAKKKRKGRNDSSPSKTEESIEEKLKLAAVDPSAVFDESQFEDVDESEELVREIEEFRLKLEAAYQESATKPKIALPSHVFPVSKK